MSTALACQKLGHRAPDKIVDLWRIVVVKQETGQEFSAVFLMASVKEVGIEHREVGFPIVCLQSCHQSSGEKIPFSYGSRCAGLDGVEPDVFRVSLAERRSRLLGPGCQCLLVNAIQLVPRCSQRIADQGAANNACRAALI